MKVPLSIYLYYSVTECIETLGGKHLLCLISIFFKTPNVSTEGDV